MNYKWIAKQLRHKKWGEWRYTTVYGGYGIEKFGDLWPTLKFGWTNIKGNPSYQGSATYYPVFNSKEDAIKFIRKERAEKCFTWCRQQRKNKAYSKRKWKYIP